MRKFKLVEIDQIEVINLEISKGMYVRTHQGIAKIVEKPNISVVVWNDRKVIYVDEIHIKSVVTREQFEAMKYVVERNK